MFTRLKCGFHDLVRRTGYELTPVGQPDFDPAAIKMIRHVHPYTMTGPERLYALREAVKYVVKSQISGDIVECGVWQGGSMMAAALTLLEFNDEARDLYLFDTYQGTPAPTDADKNWQGDTATAVLDCESQAASWNWAIASLESVQANMYSTGYNKDRLHFVKGRIEHTIPEQSPQRIAVLRLDTDWYESTYHALTYLYPRLVVGGVLILDDYGHWEGARKAVDQYFEEEGLPLLLSRVDYTGRMAVKWK